MVNLRWLPAFAGQRLFRPTPRGTVHVLLAVADHFEPSFLREPSGQAADAAEQERRVDQWCEALPRIIGEFRDHDGRPWSHTYFYPAEQYNPGACARLADFCRQGWGEVEVHLHHGLERPDTALNTRRVLREFRDRLAAHGCLSRWEGQGNPVYAFVHGNWALANSAPGGRYCGVDEELQVLSETGCYADFTLPSAPNPAQIAKINALYECALPLSQRAAHRRGRDLRRGTPPSVFPLLIQGPLLVDVAWRNGKFPFAIENGALSFSNPPTVKRFHRWCQAAIAVQGRPDWLFAKLYCHSMDPRDQAVLLGEPLREFLRQLTQDQSLRSTYRLHFVSAREMVNIALAACDGREGDPNEYRDYRLKRIESS